MERKNISNAETKSVLDGIHALYIRGKITLEQHNEWCRQACAGATSFSL
jgi:hypothetical protein